jgi:hypothetical protein
MQDFTDDRRSTRELRLQFSTSISKILFCALNRGVFDQCVGLAM